MSQQVHVRLLILHLHQDDPRKCTAAKLMRRGLVTPIYNGKRIHPQAVVLNPFSRDVFLAGDKSHLEKGLVGIDCSWKRTGEVFSKKFKGLNRRLPLLIPTNPINYGHLGMLSSVEALGAALSIAGFEEKAIEILRLFKWGVHFLELNRNPLVDYANASSVKEAEEVERSYFGRALEGEA